MKNDEIMNVIIDIFYTHKERYGYRRVAMELRNMRYAVNYKKVKPLISVMGQYDEALKMKYDQQIYWNFILRLKSCFYHQL